MIRINLLPQKVRQSTATLQFTTALLVAGGVLVVALGLVLVQLGLQVRRLDLQLAKLDTSARTVSPRIAALRTLQSQEQEITTLRQLQRQLAQGQESWSLILEALSRQVQGDCWLTHLGSQRLRTGGPLVLTLEGEAYTKISVADFLTALERGAVFTQVTLESLSDLRAGTQDQVKFQLRMQFAEKTAAVSTP